MMQGSGTAVDIVTGRPVLETRRKDPAKAQQEILEKRAADAGLFEAEATARLVKMIEDRLCARAEDLLKDDPESRGYVAMLTELGQTRNYARYAVESLRRRRLG